MKRCSALLLLAFALAFSEATHAAAPAAGTIAVVDLKKVFDGYWKTKQADLNLKDQAAELDKKRKDMITDAQKAEVDYKKLLESSTDSAVSIEERDKRKNAAAGKLRELQEIEQSVNQFDRSARAKLGEQQRNLRDKIVTEIREILSRKARAAGYAGVLDSAAESTAGTPVLLFNGGLPDLTEDILAQLNATAPAGALQTPAAPAPVPIAPK